MVEIDTAEMLLPKPNIVENPHTIAFISQQILDGNRPANPRRLQDPRPCRRGERRSVPRGKGPPSLSMKKAAGLRFDDFRDARSPRPEPSTRIGRVKRRERMASPKTQRVASRQAIQTHSTLTIQVR